MAVLNWARRRQLMYIGIILALPIFLVVRFVLSIEAPEPTCFDGEQNGFETGIDCGGICQIICNDEARNLVELWARPFFVDDDVYNIVAYVENQNTNAGLREIVYEFRLFDAGNQQIGEPILGETFIGPNESTAIFFPGVKTGDQSAQTALFRFVSETVWEKTDPRFAVPQIVVKSRTLEENSGRMKLSTLVENASLVDIEDTYVVVVLYDQRGNALAASQRFVERIDSGEQQTLTYTWPQNIVNQVADIEVIPRVNPFAN